MSIGTLTLDPIKFNVSSGLWGLKGLQGLVGVDVLGGTQDALSLATNVTIVNPSNLNIGMGDLGMYYVYSIQAAAKMAIRFSLPAAQGRVPDGNDVNAKLDSSHRQQLGGGAYRLLSKSSFLCAPLFQPLNFIRSLTIVLRVEKYWTTLSEKEVSKFLRIHITQLLIFGQIHRSPLPAITGAQRLPLCCRHLSQST
jgi:hypothetical protein